MLILGYTKIERKLVEQKMNKKRELMMAASTIVVLPMIILFLFLRKQIVNGVARGGLKG